MKDTSPEITIKGTPEDIAALVLRMQEPPRGQEPKKVVEWTDPIVEIPRGMGRSSYLTDTLANAQGERAEILLQAILAELMALRMIIAPDSKGNRFKLHDFGCKGGFFDIAVIPDWKYHNSRSSEPNQTNPKND